MVLANSVACALQSAQGQWVYIFHKGNFWEGKKFLNADSWVYFLKLHNALFF
jgi:hypothetical protein